MNKIILNPETKRFVDTGERKQIAEETRRKLNLANLGKQLSEETKEKIGLANLGKHLSEETREKISQANMGNKSALGCHRSAETRTKMSNARKGTHPAKESVEKMKASLKGRQLSVECKTKMSIAHRGQQPCLGYKQPKQHRDKIGCGIKRHFEVPENRDKISGPNSHRWQGGISKEPYPFSFTEELKEAIRNRDNHTCQLCDIPQLECLLKLRVHHIDYDKNNLSWNNLITLCNRCNSKVNWNRNYWQAYFSQTVNK